MTQDATNRHTFRSWDPDCELCPDVPDMWARTDGQMLEEADLIGGETDMAAELERHRRHAELRAQRPGQAWAEEMMLALTEVLPPDEVARLREKGRLPSSETHLLCDSHEKLRAQRPGITRQQIKNVIVKAYRAPANTDEWMTAAAGAVWALLADSTTPEPEER